MSCERFKKITGISILVLSIHFKSIWDFGVIRLSLSTCLVPPIMMKCMLYICCLNWFEANKEEYMIPYHGIDNNINIVIVIVIVIVISISISISTGISININNNTKNNNISKDKYRATGLLEIIWKVIESIINQRIASKVFSMMLCMDFEPIKVKIRRVLK